MFTNLVNLTKCHVVTAHPLTVLTVNKYVGSQMEIYSGLPLEDPRVGKPISVGLKFAISFLTNLLTALLLFT